MSDLPPGGPAPGSGGGKKKKLAMLEWLDLFRKVNNFQWIMGEVDATQQMIKRLVAQSDQSGPSTWRDSAEGLLVATEESVRARERQRAWLTLKAAQRACIYGMKEAEIRARAIELHNEAEKIDTPWRVKAIQEILNLHGTAPSNADLANADLERLFDPALNDNAVELQRVWNECAEAWRGRPDQQPTGAEALAVATSICDEHFDNLWRKVERRQNAIVTSMAALGAVTFLIVGFWKYWACLNWFDATIGPDKLEISLLVVALFGALGASLSTAYTLVSADLPNKYTEGAMAIAVTLARPIIGAAAAVAILFIYAGGLMDGLLSAKALELDIVYAVAFTSGFTERLIFSATNKIAKKPTS